MSIPSRSAESSVRDSDNAARPGAKAGGDANRPCSRRLDQMKNPPCSKPRTFTMFRLRLTKTNQRPLAGFSPRWVATSAHSPSKLRRMSAGCVDSQMPPGGQPSSIRTAEDEAPPRRRATARHPSPAWTPPRFRQSRRAFPQPPCSGEAELAAPALERLQRHPTGLAEADLRAFPAIEIRHQGPPLGLVAKLPGRIVNGRRQHIVRHEKPPIKANGSEESPASGQAGSRSMQNAVLWPLTCFGHGRLFEQTLPTRRFGCKVGPVVARRKPGRKTDGQNHSNRIVGSAACFTRDQR